MVDVICEDQDPRFFMFQKTAYAFYIRFVAAPVYKYGDYKGPNRDKPAQPACQANAPERVLSL